MIKRVLLLLMFLGMTFGLFGVGYLAWTNPQVDDWVTRAYILVVCIVFWYLAIKDIIQCSKKP